MEYLPRCEDRLRRVLLQAGVQSWHKVLEWAGAQREGITSSTTVILQALTMSSSLI
jgi:hypothetical protein